TAVAALQTVPPQAAQGAQVVQRAPGATFTPVLPPSLPSPGSLPAGTVAFAAPAPGPGAAWPLLNLNSFEIDVQRLVDAGFTRERAEALRRRADELLLEQMQSRYEAERDGKPLPTDLLAGDGPDQALREELGDDEYERYLKALGRPTEVSVFSVLADSPAA